MYNAKFQGSNTSSTDGFVDLYALIGAPASGWTTVTVTNLNQYRFLRYWPNWSETYCNVAEIEFYGN